MRQQIPQPGQGLALAVTFYVRCRPPVVCASVLTILSLHHAAVTARGLTLAHGQSSTRFGRRARPVMTNAMLSESAHISKPSARGTCGRLWLLSIT